MSVKPLGANEPQDPGGDTTTEAPARDRSGEILEAACRKIAQSGARKLSLRDVADEAGVSKALLHYYFSSRNELLARAYEFSDQRGRERVWREVAAMESGSVRLSRLLDLYLGDDPNLSADWILWSELSSSAMFEDELRPVMEAAFGRWSAWIDTLVRDAIDEGSMPADANPRETSLRIIALTDGLGSLLGRGLIERPTARSILQHQLDTEFGRTLHRAANGEHDAEPLATGYLRLLAQLVRTAVDQLHGLASGPDDEAAIRTVTALLDSRASGGVNVPSALAPRDSPISATPASRPSPIKSAPVTTLPTPAVIVDLDRLERNLERFAGAVAQHDVAFRPHAKAHKSPDVAARQLRLGAVGLAVAKPSEAEVFWAAGCRDVVVAFPVVGEVKCAHLARMAAHGHIAVNVDSEFGAEGLSRAAVAAGSVIGVQLEIDTGLRRSGVPADDIDGIERLARRVGELPGVDFEGLTSYRGLGFPNAPERELAGQQEGELMTQLAAQLRARGVDVRSVVAGSTATAVAAAAVPGITEVRAGAYPFMDAAQVAAGSATMDDVALSVLCTVVSVGEDGRLTIDGGSKTFGGGAARDRAYALSMDGRVRIEALSEEHGVGRVVAGAAPAVGDRIAFVPALASSVVGMTDELVAARNGTYHGTWRVTARGART